VLLLVLGLTLPATGAEFTFHGDFNNRFQVYTNQNAFFRAEQQGVIRDDSVEDEFGEIKYRLWTEAATNDGAVKGVYAIEIGGLRFGEDGKGARFSGDGVNIETRWAYTDFQIPFVEKKFRSRIGLQPFKVNSYFWQETVLGINLYGTIDPIDWEFGWMRPIETNAASDDNDAEDTDAFNLRVNCRAVDGMVAGVFVNYIRNDQADNPNGGIDSRNYELKKFADEVELDMWTVGLDGSYSMPAGGGNLFFNWDAMYQGGKIDRTAFTQSPPGIGGRGLDDFDLSAWFAHLDVGYKWDKTKLAYTFWYASGDDDPDDDDFEGFLSVDLDRFDNHVLFESLTDDDVFTERPYLLDKGFIMNKLRVDYNWTEKLRVGLAGMYMLAAEDLEYLDDDGQRQSNDEVGFEIDADLTYKLYKGLNFDFAVGYLIADDAMDFFEEDGIRDGSSDEDIIRCMARVRYKF
jgi:hypothetical protein